LGPAPQLGPRLEKKQKAFAAAKWRHSGHLKEAERIKAELAADAQAVADIEAEIVVLEEKSKGQAATSDHPKGLLEFLPDLATISAEDLQEAGLDFGRVQADFAQLFAMLAAAKSTVQAVASRKAAAEGLDQPPKEPKPSEEHAAEVDRLLGFLNKQGSPFAGADAAGSGGDAAGDAAARRKAAESIVSDWEEASAKRWKQCV
jgi:hypothetical protein